MKSITTTFLFLTVFTTTVFGQYPPPQGPPSTDETVFPLQFNIIKGLIYSAYKDSIMPEINRKIQAANILIDVVARLIEIKQGRPTINKTQYIDRPNENVIKIIYKVTYTVKIHGFSNRTIYQNLIITTSCAEWYKSEGGNLRFQITAEKAVPADLTWRQDNVDDNIVLALTTIKSIFSGEPTTITQSITKYLPEKIFKILQVSDIPTTCNCLGVKGNNIENAVDDYYQSSIRYRYERPELMQTNNNISISVQSIKRLNSHDDNGNILYDSLENINLEVYANHELLTFPINQISIGQEINLSENIISTPKPKQNGSLILIANVIQSNSLMTDSRFVVFANSSNFGNGTQKLIIKKKYIEKPHKLPNGQMSKSREVYVDAYELTIVIRSGVINAVRQN